MAEQKKTAGKKYRLQSLKRRENGKTYAQGDDVDLSHLSPERVKFLLSKQIYKEVK